MERAIFGTAYTKDEKWAAWFKSIGIDITDRLLHEVTICIRSDCTVEVRTMAYGDARLIDNPPPPIEVKTNAMQEETQQDQTGPANESTGEEAESEG